MFKLLGPELLSMNAAEIVPSSTRHREVLALKCSLRLLKEGFPGNGGLGSGIGRTGIQCGAQWSARVSHLNF